MKKQKLELTWIGKENQHKIEPRILIENKEKSYGDESDNMLIHGDNLLALKALEDKFTNKIKCIYIDPPYNTNAATDGAYDDNLEHSIWLNLMFSRLKILFNLLRKDGLLWISIDDANNAYLKIMCDEIFGSDNFIANLPTIMNLKGNQDQFGFAGTHEYTLVYAKNKSECEINKFELSEEEVLKEWNVDEIGYYKKGAILRATGEEANRKDRPMMFYPILVKDNVVTTIEKNEFVKLYDKANKSFNDEYLKSLIKKYEDSGYEVVLPKENEDEYGRWRWGYSDENKKRLEYDAIPVKTKNGYSIYKKQRPEINEIPSKKPKTLMYKPEYSSGNGTEQVKKIFGYKAFPYPKPEQLIADIIYMSTKEEDYVLDSFLGSGTTIAVANKMNRKWIGIEMGQQCYDLCKVRIDKVIDGNDNVGISAIKPNLAGYKFYELAPSLLVKDKFNNWIISENYNGELLTRAICKQEKFEYIENSECYWKQGISSDNDYIFVTTNYVSIEYLEAIHEEMLENESLLICCKTYQEECDDKYDNITIKKIPQAILNNCEYGRDDYTLNINEVMEIE